MSIRVLIADDQALVRDGLRAILEREADIDVVAEAGDGVEALEEAHRHHPDVILMDIRMPRLDGIATTRRLLERPRAPRVIILTTFDLDDYVYEALRAGCSGFLLKDTRREEIVNAIRVVCRGDALLSPSVTARMIEEFARRPATGRPDDLRLAELTARELEVLKLLARGLSNAEIADNLVLSHGTVKTHVARVLMKLRLRDRVQAVVLAYESGLIAPRSS
ncbi:MAG: response regulator [Solirubrobacteraceae bacterium]